MLSTCLKNKVWFGLYGGSQTGSRYENVCLFWLDCEMLNSMHPVKKHPDVITQTTLNTGLIAIRVSCGQVLII